MNKKKVTIYDVAKKLNVSTATVNRALNGSTRVSEKTRQLVTATVNEMGYKPSKTASSLSRKQIKIGVVINNTVHEFVNKIQKGVDAAFNELQDYNVSGDIHIIKSNSDVEEYTDIVRGMVNNGCSGIALMPIMSEKAFDKLIFEMKEKGIIIATLISDFPESVRDFSIRINGVVAGRMAAELLHRAVGDAPVAIVTGNRELTVHNETIKGFKEYADYKNMNFAGVYEHRDDPELAYHLAASMMKTRPDIRGIYFGTANSVTFCNKLIELGIEKSINCVASDLLPGIVELLKKNIIDAVIFQNPYKQGKLVVEQIFRQISENYVPDNKIIYLNPEIVLHSNLELYV